MTKQGFVNSPVQSKNKCKSSVDVINQQSFILPSLVIIYLNPSFEKVNTMGVSWSYNTQKTIIVLFFIVHVYYTITYSTNVKNGCYCGKSITPIFINLILKLQTIFVLI